MKAFTRLTLVLMRVFHIQVATVLTLAMVEGATCQQDHPELMIWHPSIQILL